MVAPVSAIPVGAVRLNVPPHTVAVALATVRPVGRVSVNATPTAGSTLAAGLVIVKVSEGLAFRAMVDGLDALAIEGGASTFRLAEAVPPVPPSVDVTLPVVLFCWPAAVPVTLMAKVQEELAAGLAPDWLITPVPCPAVMVPPPQEPLKPLGVATTRPAGSVSLKATPVSVVVVLLFWMVKFSEVDPFSGMLPAPKALMITGGATTVIDAFEVFPVPPSFDVTCTLLIFTPAAVPWTSTDTMHEALAASVPPDRLAEPARPTAVIEPPQVLVAFGVEATTNPAGKLSVKPRPVRVTVVLGFWIVNVKEVVPFNGIWSAPKLLVMAGAWATVRLALAVLPVPPLVEVTLPVVLMY